MITSIFAKKVGTRRGRAIWELCERLIYWINDEIPVIVPKGFQTDFASVPRVPLAYLFCGDTCHEAATVHDYLYRKDCVPNLSKEEADLTFLRITREKGEGIGRSMFFFVKHFANGSWKKKLVGDRLI